MNVSLLTTSWQLTLVMILIITIIIMARDEYFMYTITHSFQSAGMDKASESERSLFRVFLAVWGQVFFSLHQSTCLRVRGPGPEACMRSSRESSSELEVNASMMLLGLRNTSPPLAFSILLTATRRHLDTSHIPSTESSQEAEGAGAVLEDFLEEGRADQQHPSRCCPPYPEVPQADLQGQGSRRRLELQGAWLI